MNLFTWILRSVPFIASILVLFGGLAAPASADLVLSIGPELTTIVQPIGGATREITLTVFMRAKTGTESVEGYTLPVDLSPPPGKGLPLGMTITADTTAITIFGGLPFKADLNPGEGDLLAIAGALNVTPVLFDTNPSPLFNFNVLIDSTVATGDYTADFVNESLLSLDRNLTAIFDPSAIIRIVAVPEPSTLSVLGLLVVPLALRRRRRSS